MTTTGYSSRHNLFLLNGVHGGGKTAAFDVAILRKYTTRVVRKEEAGNACLDSIFASREEFAAHCQAPDFVAYANDSEYGFHLDELRALGAAHRNVLAIITNPAVIVRVARECADCNVITVFLYTDAHQVTERLSQPGMDEDSRPRTARSVSILEPYAADPLQYQHVLLNVFSPAILEQHVHALLQHYNSEHITKEQP